MYAKVKWDYHTNNIYIFKNICAEVAVLQLGLKLLVNLSHIQSGKQNQNATLK